MFLKKTVCGIEQNVLELTNRHDDTM